MKTIILLLFYFAFLLSGFFSFSQEIIEKSQPNSFFITSNISKISVSEYVKNYVENNINTWQKKDEFESTDDYLKRVNEQSRKEKVEELTQEGISSLKKMLINNYKWSQIDLVGSYDADNQSFLIDLKEFGQIVLKVPLDEARSFRDNFNNLNYQDFDFFVVNDGFVLSEFTVLNTENNKNYKWNSIETQTYSLASIEYNFAPIDNVNIQNSDIQPNKPIIVQSQMAVGRSDVAVNIPVTNVENSNIFAVIIANENYSNEVNVSFAINDGRVFKEYCEKTLGIPSTNIRYVEDATFGAMRSAINWINNVMLAYQGESKVIFFYAGHGMPNESDRSAFLLPVDGMSSDFETAIKLEELYNRLNEHPAKSVLVLLDACFSGAIRDDGMLAHARAVRVRPRNVPVKGSMVVFSASTADETAFPYAEKQHGLFTYFFLKKLQLSNGDVNLYDLSEYIIDNVRRQSIVVNQKSQTPQLIISRELEENWKTLKLK